MRSSSLILAAVLAAAGASAWAADTPESMLAGYVKQAGAPGSPERGQKFFNTNFGKDYAGCSQCHGSVPTKDGKDLLLDKKIGPLAPAFNKQRFTDRSKAEMAFNMNCKDVVGRACTAGEKADVLSWLISLKP
jgi:mono/diheme cytochrome c family protein